MSFVRRAATAIVGTASAVALTIGLVPLATAEDAVAAAQEAGDTPAEHVAWIAEHYDLQPLPR